MKKIFLLGLLLIGMIYSYAQNPIYYLLVGTYTNKGTSEGIYVYRFNPNKTEVTFMSKTSDVDNPSYLTVSKDQKFVYCVNENSGDKPGSVSSFAFDKSKGELHFLNKQPSGGDAPCFINIDATGKNVIAANYMGGNFSIFKTNSDGSLNPFTQLIAHQGYGINVQRQEMPHPHAAVFSPDEKYVFVPDLGNDRLYQYHFNPTDATKPVTEADPPYYEIPDGSGPRQFIFHPNGKNAYLLNELSGDIIVFDYANGKLTQTQTISSDITGDKEDKASADIHISNDPRFLYTTNRGKSNNIALYKVSSDGKLASNGQQPVGQNPRFFMIDPSGRFLLVANQDSNNIQIFIINKNFGLLQDSGVKIDVPQPSCLVMIPVK
ncbi:MAG: lactonase family protein [Bacteroidetes bacterium]|nr:lactonase family protein [Bacteroidota bacterium]